MEKIKNIIKSYEIFDLLILLFVMLIYFFLFTGHFQTVFTDRGRELLIPQEILNGAVPYKDILLIYFPLSYYINAFVYKVLGVSVNSLFISQLFFCTCFIILYYFIAREFLSRKMSLFLGLFVISSCIYANNDLFSYITPYSYGRVFGILGSVACLYFMLQLFKQDNPKYLYLSSLYAGFAFSNKFEFFSSVIVLILGICLYKKKNINDILKSFVFFSVFPIITALILIVQGVSIQNITEAIKFAVKFSTTPVMNEFLGFAGMYPSGMKDTLFHFFKSFPQLFIFLLSTLGGFWIAEKYKKPFVLVLTFLFVLFLNLNNSSVDSVWFCLPFVFVILFCCFFTKIKTDKMLLFLLLSALILSQREFFRMTLLDYGTYSFPLLLLGFCIILKYCFKENTEKALCFLLIVFIGFYSYNDYLLRQKTPYQVKTPKGTFYTDYNNLDLALGAMSYINSHVSEDEKVLVIPEGTMLNYLTGAKADLKCFMMDRLYHDAYGETKALEIVKNTNSKYIILIDNDDIYHFERDPVFDKNSTLVGKYIWDNYSLERTIEGLKGYFIFVLEKK